jgi:pyrroloquinoline quinone biosynthesis protein D
VLAPERLFLPDEQAVEILHLIDGARDVDRVIDELVRQYEAPREVIAGDVTAMLQDLVDKKVLRR